MFKDPVFLLLVTALCVTLLLFMLDIFPYPFGLIILLAFIAMRLLRSPVDDQTQEQDHA